MRAPTLPANLMRSRGAAGETVGYLFPITGDGDAIGFGDASFAVGLLDRGVANDLIIANHYSRRVDVGESLAHGRATKRHPALVDAADCRALLAATEPDQRGMIERVLAHAGGKKAAEEGLNVKVEGAYNRSVHLAPRRRLLDAWAAILAGGAAGPADTA